MMAGGIGNIRSSRLYDDQGLYSSTNSVNKTKAVQFLAAVPLDQLQNVWISSGHGDEILHNLMG